MIIIHTEDIKSHTYSPSLSFDLKHYFDLIIDECHRGGANENMEKQTSKLKEIRSCVFW